jgi:protein disulfide-isomerase-like protein
MLSDNDFSGTTLKLKDNTLVLFYADWCGHCQRVKPIWDELSSKFNLHKVDCSNSKDMKVVKNLQIEGYPTILFFKNGEAKGKYDGDRSAESLVEYINANGVGTFSSGESSPKAMPRQIPSQQIQPQTKKSSTKNFLFLLFALLFLLAIGFLGYNLVKN